VEIKLTTPFSAEDIDKLKAGDQVLLSGVIYTGRDAAHKRLCELLDAGKELPVDLNEQVIYFVGPSPAKPGKVIGSAGPTTSYRMDAYSPQVIKEAGLRGMIGKGGRGQEVVDAMCRYGCVYFAATGGAAALISKSIISCEVVCYEDLGPEAIHRLEVKDMPLIVAIDSHGNNLYT
jgi:fumarate hydratase subunit beta